VIRQCTSDESRADRVGAPLTDEAEEVRWIPFADLSGLIATGKILGAATIIGAQHALLTAVQAGHEYVPGRNFLTFLAPHTCSRHTPTAR
jgi:hypothetical protein